MSSLQQLQDNSEATKLARARQFERQTEWKRKLSQSRPVQAGKILASQTRKLESGNRFQGVQRDFSRAGSSVAKFAESKKFQKALPKAIAGLAGAMLPAGAMPQKGGGAGRGRPYGTFKPKMLPSGQIVYMPVQAYKRAVSMQRAQMRMQAELAKTRAGMQPSYGEMPQGYGGYDAEDAFLNQPQQQQMPMQQQGMQGYPQQGMSQGEGMSQSQPGFLDKMKVRFRTIGDNMNNLFGGQQQGMQGYPQQGYPGQQFQGSPRPAMSAGMGQTQRISLWGNGAGIPKERNILNTPNIFNRRGTGRMPLV